jgi:plasmid stabilization system protein ParE
VAHELTWSPAARLDLKEIFAYIAEDDPIAGKKFIRSLFMAVELRRCGAYFASRVCAICSGEVYSVFATSDARSLGRSLVKQRPKRGLLMVRYSRVRNADIRGEAAPSERSPYRFHLDAGRAMFSRPDDSE